MAIAFVQRIVGSTDNDNASATFQKNPSANTTQNNFLVAVFANEDATPVKISDAIHGDWNTVVTRALNGACAMIMAWVKLTTALTTSDAITFHKNAAGNRPSLVWVGEFSGMADSPFDVGTSNPGTDTSMETGTTAALAEQNELAIVGHAMDTDVSNTIEAGYTQQGAVIGPAAGGSSGGGGHVIFVGYKALGATTSGQQEVSSRGAGAVAWTAMIGTFKEAAGGGGGDPEGLLIGGKLVGRGLLGGVLVN